MDALKKKLFDVLAKTITTEEFENWLYSDEEINSSLEDNDMLFDIVSINYRSKHAYYELKEYCLKYYDYDEYLVSLVESSCRKLVRARTSEEVWPFVMHISSFMDWDKNYGLINQFYYLDDELSLVQEGYYKEKNVIAYINKMAQVVLKELESRSMAAKIESLKDGIEVDDSKTEIHESEFIKSYENSKKWYQFWK